MLSTPPNGRFFAADGGRSGNKDALEFSDPGHGPLLAIGFVIDFRLNLRRIHDIPPRPEAGAIAASSNEANVSTPRCVTISERQECGYI
jgi:hypothetical protein